jgi:hypothetical protein
LCPPPPCWRSVLFKQHFHVTNSERYLKLQHSNSRDVKNVGCMCIFQRTEFARKMTNCMVRPLSFAPPLIPHPCSWPLVASAHEQPLRPRSPSKRVFNYSTRICGVRSSARGCARVGGWAWWCPAKRVLTFELVRKQSSKTKSPGPRVEKRNTAAHREAHRAQCRTPPSRGSPDRLRSQRPRRCCAMFVRCLLAVVHYFSASVCVPAWLCTSCTLCTRTRPLLWLLDLALAHTHSFSPRPYRHRNRMECTSFASANREIPFPQHPTRSVDPLRFRAACMCCLCVQRPLWPHCLTPPSLCGQPLSVRHAVHMLHVRSCAAPTGIMSFKISEVHATGSDAASGYFIDRDQHFPRCTSFALNTHPSFTATARCWLLLWRHDHAPLPRSRHHDHTFRPQLPAPLLRSYTRARASTHPSHSPTPSCTHQGKPRPPPPPPPCPHCTRHCASRSPLRMTHSLRTRQRALLVGILQPRSACRRWKKEGGPWHAASPAVLHRQ